MHHVIVRTKLQAVIAKQLLDDGIISNGFHLVLLSNSREPPLDAYCGQLIRHASKVTRLVRPRHGFISLFAYFLGLLSTCRARGDSIFLANVNWYPFATAIRFVPGLMITTFDDGAANIQSNSKYLREAPSSDPGPRGLLAKFLFPRGPSAFVRSRIATHYTIYPGYRNIVDASKLVEIAVHWQDLIDESDIDEFPKGVARILLGTVHDEATRFWNVRIAEEDLKNAMEWADLYIPHPRQPFQIQPPSVVTKYPAEAVISHYAKDNAITVAHYNSSATILYRTHPNVSLVDLSRMDTKALFNSEC